MENSLDIQLSPPWITYFNELKFSIGEDPEVTVGPLIPVGSTFIALVTVSDNQKAIALATLLKSSVEFGNITVNVVVVNGDQEIVNPLPCPLSPFTVAALMETALSGNPYFVEVVVKPQIPGEPDAVYPVFTPEVIQFFNDDISNLCNTFTGVAANVFADVLVESLCDVPILYSTSCEE
ncbi:hypothetical protein FZC84_00260 [Rossellomorea vietnamensis]|uniref:Group-specific protein n=1 Tax=Rossellomorea vietnamensis TaxID=218284 RepID=A0A5D4MIC2_9BACI|nr:hypothetical protein [Rossellomorea vietnamensis]TYS01139.1 hypothetical protein FZC84_00260 [Rossellomorea vietnamensis]